MARSRDLSDDVVAHPAFEIVRRQLVTWLGYPHRGTDAVRELDRHATTVFVARPHHLSIGGFEPASQPPASEPVDQLPRTGEQARHPEAAVCVDRELHVIDVAAPVAVTIEQLAVEQVEPCVEHTRRADHAPPFVMMISGITANETATSSTRYASATAFLTGPLTWSTPT